MSLELELPQLLVVDRSTLERFDSCPAQAKFVADNRVITSSHLTEVGSAVHEALGEVVREYVESRGNLGVDDMTDTAIQLLCASRSDVQHDAIRAMQPSIRQWARYINGIHYQNVLRYDGGEGEHSGQVAVDIPDLGVRVTSEIDLLTTGRATEIVVDDDYKSGHKRWTAADVEQSFQFAMHAWLIFETYPDVQAVEVRIWNTRFATQTYSVTWQRRDLYELQWRIRSSVSNWLRWRDKPAEQCATWPTAETCRICPAAALCPATPNDVRVYLKDHNLLVSQIVAVSERLDALKRIAGGIVEATGQDIVTNAGDCYGSGKPKADRKPTMTLYQKGTSDGEGE